MSTTFSSARAQLAALPDAARRWVTAHDNTLYPLLIFFVTRLTFYLVGSLALMVMHSEASRYPPGDTTLFSRWDSAWYLTIARDGYSYAPNSESSVAFFPLYPVLIVLSAPLLNGDDVLTGTLISHICFFVALQLLYRLIQSEGVARAAARRALFYLAAFPTAFVFSAVYTESLFLLCAVAVFYCARHFEWLGAAIFGALASATRSIGVVLLVPALLLWWRAMRPAEPGERRWRRALYYSPALLWFALIPVGLGAYMAFLHVSYGDGFLYVEALRGWSRLPQNPLVVLWHETREVLQYQPAVHLRQWSHVLHVFNLLSALSFLVLGAAVWRRLGAAYGVYTLAGVLLPLAGGLDSQFRYVLVLFPGFIMLGLWGRWRWLDRALSMLFPTLGGLMAAFFTNWYFVV